MKKHSRIVAILTTLILCIAPLFASALTVRAEGPVTYYLKYQADKSEWRYQVGNTWEDNEADGTLQDLVASIKDGDSLAIDGEADLLLDLNVHLVNLSIVRATQAVVAAKSIDEFYALGNSVSAISGNVKNAYIYDGCLCNFNNNVSRLELLSENNVNLSATVAVAGTVGHLKASGSEFVHFEFYNFTANSLLIEDGHLKTLSTKYSEKPQAGTTPAATPAPTTPSAPAGEYDDVPKTGDFSISPLWFLGIAALCLTGQYSLKRR